MDKTLQQMSAPRWPRIAIISTLLLLSLPIVLGFGATLAAAFDYAPALGRNAPSFEPFIALFQTPGFWRSLALSIWTGLASTIFALSFAIAIVAQGKPAPKLIAPLLATPHAAIGLGLGFMIAPTGVIVRLLFAPFGIEIPPQITTVNDPIGLAIILALIIKELPFLIFVLYAARDQIPMREHQAIARSMGYHPITSFIRVALPQLYPLIRLPVLAVLGFAIGVVDIAIILGPSTPPTLAVSAVRWFNNPDLNFLFVASASAVVIASITAATLGLALIAEKLVLRFVLRRAQSGDRCAVLWPWYLLQNVGRATLILGASGIFLTLVWSFSFRWPFPYILPTEWSLRVWQLNGKGLFGAASMTLLVATSATAIAFVFTVLWLEAETYFRRLHLGLTSAVIYIPLIAPQIAFLFGINSLLLRTGLTNGLLAAIWGHVIFVFPYLMITMADSWRNFDQRYIQGAQSMGKPAMERLIRVKIPILSISIITALAIGFAVSVAQFLPTLFLGGGRVETLTTEAVALSAGGDRRIAGAYGFLQAMLPLVVYLGARYWTQRRQTKMGLNR